MSQAPTDQTNDPPSQQACNKSGPTIGGMCINWRVVGGLAAVGVGIWVMAPNLIAAAAPLLIFAICPLSMMLMMRSMSNNQNASPAQQPGGSKDLAALKAEHARVTAELQAAQRGDERAPLRQ